MKVLCCGDREWKDWRSIRRALESLGPNTVIVHGDCRGADKMCGFVASQFGYSVDANKANWGKYGLAAGPIRNAEMLTKHRDIGLVLAFHDNISASKGTKDMVAQARAAGIPVNFVRSDE